MGSSSFEFIAFAFIVVIIYQLFCSPLWRQLVLLTASCWFLSTFTHDYRAYIPFIAFLLIVYVCLQIVHRAPERAFAFVITATIMLFVWLKKYSFVPLSMTLPFPYLTVGLSYILFRVLHLMIDSHYGQMKDPISPFHYLLYTINFTTLVSGPIQKYPEFKAMIEAPGSTRPGLPEIGAAVERIVTGVFKTNVLALILSDLQASALAQLARGADGHGYLIPGVLAFASYPLFLYCNFSGYIDIVIGIARLLGITLPENFNRPFSSDSFIGLWGRWHITLSEWLKTYVYNPLLMLLMRRYSAPNLEPFWAVLAFFVTFFLVGVWHGQTAAFLFFGFLQGFAVSVNKLYQILMTKWLGRTAYQSLSSNPHYVAVARGLTFTSFTFTLIWFWSDWNQIRSLFWILGWSLVEIWVAILIGSTLILALWEALRAIFLSIKWQGNPIVYTRYWRTAWNTGLLVIVFGVGLLSSKPPPEMVYKAF
jgi:D-alanyl-lipoteichoic acid acyltransferase DltB (MBOAT superfamily)